MVCTRCTLLHSTYVAACRNCGHPLRPALQRASDALVAAAPTGIGVLSGGALLTCLAIALVLPEIGVTVLGIGAYFGIISITNAWLAIYRGDQSEFLLGTRGIGYSVALLVSLMAELARMQGISSLALPTLGQVPVPSAMATEMLAAALIVLDPLLVSPLLRWIVEGVDHGQVEVEAKG